MIRFFLTLLTIVSLVIKSNCHAQEPTTKTTTEVVRSQDIKWQPLNPARGDKGPQAGTLWGDQTGSGASGFLVKFVDGFSSPPHIHNITYRGVVISGGLHNDDPDAEPMWMKAGSFWTQPAGEVHITAARGASTAYVEIQSGPYLVMPPAKAFDEGERPVNVDASNLVWLDSTSTTWVRSQPDSDPAQGPKVAFLWGIPQKDHKNGTMVMLPGGFTGKLVSQGTNFRCILIKGQIEHQAKTAAKAIVLDEGSYFGSTVSSEHAISSVGGSTLYVSITGTYQVIAE